MWNAAIAGEEHDIAGKEGLSIACMRKRLAEARPAFLENVDSIVREDRLDESFVNAACATPEVFTYGGMIAYVLTFAAIAGRSCAAPSRTRESPTWARATDAVGGRGRVGVHNGILML